MAKGAGWYQPRTYILFPLLSLSRRRLAYTAVLMLHSFARIQILRRLACRYVKGDPWWLRNYISRIASSDELEFREMVRVPIVLYTRCCKATMHEAEERSMMTGTVARRFGAMDNTFHDTFVNGLF